MNPLHDISSSGVQSFLTPWFPCPYLPDRKARMQVATPKALITFQVYSDLAQLGFRRSGTLISRPNCEACQACVPVRIEIANFKPSRVQRYTWKHHSSLEVSVHPLKDESEYFELYQRYMQARHADGENAYDLRAQYRDYLMESGIDSRLVEFRENGLLRMVSIVDVHKDSLSLMYTFYEPSIAQSSFGTYSVLWLVEWCRQLQLPYLHNSYWIKRGTKLSYKSNFNSLQGFVHDTWQPISC